MTTRAFFVLALALLTSGCFADFGLDEDDDDRPRPRPTPSRDITGPVPEWGIDGEGLVPGEQDDIDWTVTRFGVHNGEARFDYTSDGEPDNAAGQIMFNPLIQNATGDLNFILEEAIESGRFFQLVDSVGFDDLSYDDHVGIRWVSEDVAPGIAPNELPAGFLSDGTLQTAGEQLLIALPIADPPVQILLREPRLRAELINEGQRMLAGAIGGAIDVLDFQNAILRLDVLQGFADIIRGLLPQLADVDLDADGTPDAISISLFFEAENLMVEVPESKTEPEPEL